MVIQLKKKGLLTSVYEMASSAFGAMAKIPFIGPILGAAAAASALALGMGYVGKADDMFSLVVVVDMVIE